MNQKPLKIDLTDGKVKQFSPIDTLPNQPDIEELRIAFGELVFELFEMGIEIKSQKVQKFLKYVK
jgi:hypothetical protein